jgi:hypothetical protein
MRFTVVLGVVAVASILALASPAHAQFGAIAYDNANCAWGDSWNFANQAAANMKAIAECKQPGCRAIAPIGAHLCGALATTPNCKGFGWASRPTRDAAALGAMQECQKFNAGQCSVKVSDCNR